MWLQRWNCLRAVIEQTLRHNHKYRLGRMVATTEALRQSVKIHALNTVYTGLERRTVPKFTIIV